MKKFVVLLTVVVLVAAVLVGVLISKNNTLKDEKAALNTSLTDAEKKAADLTAQIDAKTAEIGKVQSDYDAYVASAEATNADALALQESYDAQLAELKAALEAKTAELTAAQEKYDAYAAQAEESNTEALAKQTEYETQIAALTADVEKARTEYDAYTVLTSGQIETLTADLAAAKAEAEAKGSEVETLTAQLTQLQSQLAAAASVEKTAETVTVTVLDSDGVTVLNELVIESGSVLTDLGVQKAGYALSGVFVTPALLRPFDFATVITEDTKLFVAWKSAAVDEREWMIAGSLKGYPENNWGHILPQDNFRLKKIADNTYYIELNLYEGDQFKIAVIDENYTWGDNLGSSCLVDRTYVTGGEDAFATGANCQVLEDGYYGLTFTTDVETLQLCKLSVEKLGEAAAAEYQFSIGVHASFFGWDETKALMLTQNGADYLWYGEFDVTEDGYQEGCDYGEFGIKNFGSIAWFANADGSNFQVKAGHYMIFVELTADNKLVSADFGTPAYYVVGTCGNGNWAADANEENTKYQMVLQEDGTYALKVTFTNEDVAQGSDQVSFKVVYGCCGRVANEYWYGIDGSDVKAAPGEYTVAFDPATGTVTVQ